MEWLSLHQPPVISTVSSKKWFKLYERVKVCVKPYVSCVVGNKNYSEGYILTTSDVCLMIDSFGALFLLLSL